MKQEDIFALVPSWKHPGVFPVIWFELSLASFVGCVALACLLFPLSQGGKTEEQMEADKMARQKSLSRECRKNGDRPLIPRPPSMAQQARHKASHSYTKQRNSRGKQSTDKSRSMTVKERKRKAKKGEQRGATQSRTKQHNEKPKKAKQNNLQSNNATKQRKTKGNHTYFYENSR